MVASRIAVGLIPLVMIAFFAVRRVLVFRSHPGIALSGAFGLGSPRTWRGMFTLTELGIFAVWVFIAIAIMCGLVGCDQPRTAVVPGPTAVSGVHEVKPEVKTGSDGLTNEQRNIKERYHMDSMPGSIKHLYVISAYSGDVLIYSTVKGKVTSSGKRLTPTSVHAGVARRADSLDRDSGIPINIGGKQQLTGEVLQDDGTYGHSIDYLYWFDSKGIFHCHYPTGGQIIHIASEPLAVKRVILNLEQVKD